ncbi:MAG: acyl-CoA desaturase [Planctomycetota bacterium]|jgi:stearoyl-CoA desaturase (delta-9 desaturase)
MNQLKTTSAPKGRPLMSIIRWIDSEASGGDIACNDVKRVDWFRIVPFILLHTMCFVVIFVGWSWTAVLVATGLYFIRMFAITGFYHRYFSHRTFKTNRFWQFFFAVIGNASVQRGPLWWASHHRHHHRYADQKEDVHSPSQHGFWWSHMGWLTSPANFATDVKYVRDWIRFPELRWINRFDTVIPILLAIILFAVGEVLKIYAPHLGTNGPQMLVWGFFVSSMVLFHATVTINSFDHMIGSRRYATQDTSRNNPVLAIITLGEGWHNNHHHYAVCARQGFYWWEIDVTYYVLVLMSWLGIIWDIRPIFKNVRNSNLISTETSKTLGKTRNSDDRNSLNI